MCFVVRISLMKLVSYQQLTCLCVKMEFVVGMISLSCELYSLSWSCFCSRGSGTIVYGKWCFDLHVEYSGSYMVSTIGVWAGKFLGVRRIFPNLPEMFWATLPTNFSLKDHEDLFWDDLQNKVFMCFSTNVGRHFMKSIKVRRHFCPDFQRFFPGFQGFYPDFQ